MTPVANVERVAGSGIGDAAVISMKYDTCDGNGGPGVELMKILFTFML